MQTLMSHAMTPSPPRPLQQQVAMRPKLREQTHTSLQQLLAKQPHQQAMLQESVKQQPPQPLQQ